MRNKISVSVLLCVVVLAIYYGPSVSESCRDSECKAWLVQSIPTDMPHLPPVSGVLSTGDVLQWMASNSSKNLDITALYWQFIAQPDNPRSGDYGYSAEDLRRFGADEGSRVFKAIEDAADRNVSVRIVQHSGLYPDYANESADLAKGRPNVENVTLLFTDWWGSGVLHTKVWISDSQDVYIGSANNDWKALTQVKEVGIYLVGCPKLAKEVGIYFNNLRKLASLNASDYTQRVRDQEWQIKRRVPCWSHFIDPKARCRSPLPSIVKTPHATGYPKLSDPQMLKMSVLTPGRVNSSTSQPHLNYLSFAPPELSFGKYQTDEQAWVDTIQSVGDGEIIRINTMDWLGQSQYIKGAVYWPSISSAISKVVFSKHATVRLLAAYWTHSKKNTDQYLRSLLYSNVLCSSSKYNKCSGRVEIKYYVVPGFDVTGPASKNGTSTGNIFPGFTRVNHGKYAVSDARAHVGTSNLVWDYFYTTAGISFGTYNPTIVSQLQEIFDADWNSPYAISVEEFQEAQAYSSS